MVQLGSRMRGGAIRSLLCVLLLAGIATSSSVASDSPGSALAGNGGSIDEKAVGGVGSEYSSAELDLLSRDADRLNELLEDCPIVQQINRHKAATVEPASSVMQRVFATLFPSTPAVNAILATLYISGPPNILLALCPPSIDPSSLKLMVSFAVGGLMGDTLFHLLPEIFVGEEGEGGAALRVVPVEPNRNLLLGVGIMVGFVAFMIMDKLIRIMTGDGEHSHSHSHSHAKPAGEEKEGEGVSTGVEDSSGEQPRLRRGEGKEKEKEEESAAKEEEDKRLMKNQSASYLALLADFTHNITDGLALGSAFYASPTVGATTTMAVFFHEIPHEVGDFALLIKSGFTKRMAMGAQFVTATGAMLGTLLSIAVNEFSGSAGAGAGAGIDVAGPAAGLFGTSVRASDMLLPFTAGTFLYVGTVGVIPDMLESSGKGGLAEVWALVSQVIAMAVGACVMLAISWS